MPIGLTRRMGIDIAASLVMMAAVPGIASAQDVVSGERGHLLRAAAELMSGARYCALVTVDESGQPQARAMDPFPPEDDMTVWLGTHSGTRKIGQIRQHPEVSLFYLDASGGGYVTLIGDAELVGDPAEKARRWKESWQAFYRDGNRGDDYLLIRVRPRRLEIVSQVHGIASEPDAWKPAIVELGGNEGETGEAVPEGYWSLERARALRDKTLVLRLAPDLSALGAGERAAVDALLKAGQIVQRLYEDSLHDQALEAHGRLRSLQRQPASAPLAEVMLDLYRVFNGPIATTLSNERAPFLPVGPSEPGKNVYPRGVAKADVERFLSAQPERREAILHLRTVVRRAEPAQIRADLGELDAHPGLDQLHPRLRESLVSLLAGAEAAPYYAIPYSLAYADELRELHGLLWAAADDVAGEDPDLADYLRQRARDLLADDYEAGDAAWVRGEFRNLNAQIGSYETYDDALFGVKSFFGLSLLVRDEPRSRELQAGIRGLQQLEDALPCANHKKVRDDIPVGVYNVVADFGQARGTNTATILPNESHISRKYGRTILLRANIMTHPDLFETARAAWTAAVAEEHHQDLVLDGDFYRTLWHEIGHYLGPSQDRRGRDLDQALEEHADLIEELKSDLVALFAARFLRDQGLFDQARLDAVYASGIRRVLQKTEPRRSQPYQTMQLMQMNYFLEQGLLAFDAGAGKLRIHHDRYHEVVAALLERVLAVQDQGDKASAAAFIDEYATWDEGLHGVLAEAMRAIETHRYRLVKYGALGE